MEIQLAEPIRIRKRVQSGDRPALDRYGHDRKNGLRSGTQATLPGIPFTGIRVDISTNRRKVITRSATACAPWTREIGSARHLFQ